MGFFSVMPIYYYYSGTGLKELSKKKTPVFLALMNEATSA